MSNEVKVRKRKISKTAKAKPTAPNAKPPAKNGEALDISLTISTKVQSRGGSKAKTPEQRAKEDEVLDRDSLILKYQSYVRGVVGKLIRALSLPADLSDEYTSAGYVGLIEAAERYEASSGVDFRTYAYLRIRGAIVDSIRESHYLSCKAYRFAKALQAQHRLREEQLDRRASEVAPSRPDLAEVLDGVAMGALVYRLSGDSAEEVLTRLPDQERNAEEKIEFCQEGKSLRGWVETLPEKERLIVQEYYFQEKSFTEIVDSHEGFSKSWVSRLHTRALRLLKERMLDEGSPLSQSPSRSIETSP